MRVVEAIDLRKVQLSESRETVPAAVNALAESMRLIGLQSPVMLKRAVVMDRGVAGKGYRVVAGNHRVSAARALGWTEIDAFVIEDADVLMVQLIEIDENLCRAELTPAQRANAIARRKQIWEAMQEKESGTTCPTLPATGRGNTQFAADTAMVSGESKRDVNRHVHRAESLGDDINEVVGTSLDKGVELDALARMPADERRPIIEAAKAGENVSARRPAKAKDDRATFVAWFVDRIGELADKFESDAKMNVDDAVTKFQSLINPDDTETRGRVRELAKFYAKIAEAANA